LPHRPRGWTHLASWVQGALGTGPRPGRPRLVAPAISRVPAPSDPPDRALSDRVCLLEGFPPPRVFRRSQSTGADAIVYRPSAGSGRARGVRVSPGRSEEHTSELQSRFDLV